MLYWWPGWLICLEHEAIDVDDKVVGHSEFPTFFLACWLVDWLHVTLNRKLGFFRYALIIGPLTSSFLSLHQISYTRVTIRAPLGRGFAASGSVAINKNYLVEINIWQFYHDVYQFSILNSILPISPVFFNLATILELCKLDRENAICQLANISFFDSAYPNTAKSDISPFSSQNACTFISKQLFGICFLTIIASEKVPDGLKIMSK